MDDFWWVVGGLVVFASMDYISAATAGILFVAWVVAKILEAALR